MPAKDQGSSSPLRRVESAEPQPSRTLRKSHKLFSITGGLHCAGFFDIDGNLECIREDVGLQRISQTHNPLFSGEQASALQQDSWLLRQDRLLTGSKSCHGPDPRCRANFRTVVFGSKTAEDLGVTLVGFAHHESANICSYGDRIKLPATVQSAEARFES